MAKLFFTYLFNLKHYRVSFFASCLVLVVGYSLMFYSQSEALILSVFEEYFDKSFWTIRSNLDQ